MGIGIDGFNFILLWGTYFENGEMIIILGTQDGV
jgi:hypothetical protein